MTVSKIESKKQVTYTQNTAVSDKTAVNKSVPIMSFEDNDKTKGLTVEKTYTATKNGVTKTFKTKNAAEIKIEQQQYELDKAKKEQGFIGSSWDWIKNKTGIGDSSDKAQKQIDAERNLLKQIQSGKADKSYFKEVTGLEYTQENIQKFKDGKLNLKSAEKINGYKEGQEMAVDVAADVVSGVSAFGIYTASVAAAPFTGGASIAVGIVAAGASGAAIKSTMKAVDAATGRRKYTLKDAKHDTATGAFSGALAPITAGTGGAVAKTVATKFGLQAIKTVGKETAEEVVETGIKQTVKTALTNPAGYKYVGESTAKKAIAYGTEVIADAGINGGVDGSFRAAIDGGNTEDIAKAGLTGFVSGAVVGSAFKGVGLAFGGKAHTKDTPTPKTAESSHHSGGIPSEVHSDKAVHSKKSIIESKVKDSNYVTEREALKEKIKTGKKVKTDKASTQIPECKLAAPSSKFAETDEAFVNIIKSNKLKILQLNRKNGDEFIQEAFQFLKEEMGLGSAPIKLKIVDEIDNFFNGTTATVQFSRNWKNGDKAEIIGGLAHELNHFFQNKEIWVNRFLQDKDNITIDQNLLSYLLDVDEYFTNQTPFFTKKANDYLTSFQNYIQPEQNYAAYRAQLVENESFSRGNIVVDAFREVSNGLKLDNLEQTAINKIIEHYSNKLNVQELQDLVNFAILDLKNPRFKNASLDEFLNYFYKEFPM